MKWLAEVERKVLTQNRYKTVATVDVPSKETVQQDACHTKYMQTNCRFDLTNVCGQLQRTTGMIQLLVSMIRPGC